jgi:antitoxin MazE
MTAVLSRWGNSLAVRIPANMAEKANIHEGDKLEVRVSRNGRITLESKPKEIDFGALYDAITPENRVAEVLTGSEIGNEIVAW